ncbi:MAG: periplasmic heavy metal sensor [Nannocystaceae bacterium]
MFPNFVRMFRHARGCADGACHPHRGCGPRGHRGPHDHDHGEGHPGFRWFGHGGGDHGEGGGFGVRRPLRFLAHRLGLEDDQIAELARILDDLKTERAQASVDMRRSTAALADLLAAEAFDPAVAEAAVNDRVTSATRLNKAIAGALGRIHAVLNAGQRSKLAMLIRGGILSI